MKVKSESEVAQSVRLFATPWTVAYQAPLSMGFFQTRILEWGAIAFSELMVKFLLFLFYKCRKKIQRLMGLFTQGH